MQNKQLGIILIILGLITAGLVFSLINQLQEKEQKANCKPTADCAALSKKLDLSHIVVGVIAAIISLGIYLTFFSITEEAILQRLEEEKNNNVAHDKFALMLKVLDPQEAKVLQAIKEQDGITQHTLRLRTDLSKAKLSQILTSFEKKNLVRREAKGKTLAVFLKERI